MKLLTPASLDVSDGTATAGDVLSPKTFYAGEDPTKKVGTITEATDLSSVDADLVTGNIKNGVTIFGVAGHVDVRDISDGDALVGEVMNGKTFYAVGGARKTGTLATQTLNPANETVNAGYYAATTLSAVDGDLVTGNIKNGVTIFGVAGDVDVRDVSDANAVAADVESGKTFYAVGGARKTGTHVCETPDVEEDLAAQAEDYSDNVNHTSGTYGRATMIVSSEVTLQSETDTYDALSMAWAGATCSGMAELAYDIKLRLRMGGVEVALSAEWSNGAGSSDSRVVAATRKLDGSQTIIASLYTYGGGGDFYVYGDNSNSNMKPGGLVFGSIKAS